MPRVLQVPGKKVDAKSVDLGPWTGLLNPEVIQAVEVSTARDAAGALLPLEAADDDIVEVELADGARLWMRVDEIPDELNTQPSRDSSGTLRIPAVLTPSAQATRGLGTLLIKGLTLFKVDDALASMAAKELAESLEAKRKPGDGLYRCEAPDSDLLPVESLDASKPILLLIHGTLSSTAGAFGKLMWESNGAGPFWPRIKEKYDQRILAFEHRTLTESPITTALKLADKLSKIVPKDATLHLVTHSRGGLVGELLARSRRVDGKPPFDERDLSLFEDAKDPRWRQDHPQQLRDLGELLKDNPWKIEEFVRVAATARGTLLASARLDRWLSMLVNLIGLATGAGAHPAYQFAKSTLLAFAKRRTRPDELPGLAAQMPSSPVVAMLNRQEVMVEGRLSVLAGDCQGRGILGTLKVLAADLFYREDHDLVVQTSGMYGGAPRPPGKTESYLDRGGEVDHFHYFANPRTRQKLLEALEGKRFEVTGARAAVSRAPAVKLEQEEDDGSKPLVLLLPGIMGSHLAVNGNRIWVDYDDLMFGEFAKLDLRSPTPAMPDGLLTGAYQEIVSFLAKSHYVEQVDYDWRKSMREAASKLAGVLEARLRDFPKRSVRILAHSMGGQVARLTFAMRPELWDQFRRRAGSRLVMAGTPSRGSWSIVAVLLGQDRMVRYLETLDLRHSMKEVLEIVARFPGVLELLPAATEEWDFFDPSTWDRLAERTKDRDWALPASDHLEAARAVHAMLARAPSDPERMIYVAGLANGTPDRFDTEAREPLVAPLGEGDGRSLWKDGPPPGVSVWYRHAVHGDLLCGDFEAFVQLLSTGSTQLLSQQKPPARTVARSTSRAEIERVGTLPSPEEFERAILGGEGAPSEPTQRRPLRIGVVHGNAVYATAPTAVGHYMGDGLFSAEADLDRHLGGALRKRLGVGLYPGPQGTAEVFLANGRSDLGAIVVGLGRIGELTAGALAEGITRGVLRYVMTVEERRNLAPEVLELPKRFSSLLIGSTEGSSLTLYDSLRAILNGVAIANRTLESQPDRSVPLIEEIEVTELWEDRALQAAHLVNKLAEAGEVEISPSRGVFSRGDGGRRRAFEEPRGGWWRRLQIGQTSSGTLVFVAQTEKARLETKLVATQVELIRELVRHPTESTRTDPAIGVTLHELLLPEDLKGLSQSEQRLVFQLDAEAAQFPWELLVDRGNDGEGFSGAVQTPLAVRTGLVRQLETLEYREHVIRCDRRVALVISDPASSASLVPLPGARAEASEVRALLKDRGFEVEAVGRFTEQQESSTDPLLLLSRLMGRGYKVLHLAGHGAHDPKDSKKSGLVIGTLGTGDKAAVLLLTPAEIRQLREVPELVFVNACHLGRLDQRSGRATHVEDRVSLAANLGIELIRMGVRAVIAAGWEVDDAAARTFARSFYTAFLDGAAFGDAVLQARAEIYRLHPTVNTWGAYQCYGDPYYRLAGPEAILGASSRWVDPIEARDAISNLLSDLRVPQRDGSRVVRERLVHFEEQLPVEWRTHPMVASALAKVYQEIGDFDRALGYYNDAFSSPSEGVGLEAVENWVKVVVRDTAERLREGTLASPLEVDVTPERLAKIRLRIAIQRLAQVLLLGRTGERLALMASARKRLAVVSRDKNVLATAALGYKQAARDPKVAVYALVNYVLCRYLSLSAVPPPRLQSLLLKALESSIRRAKEMRESRPVFEVSIQVADARLLLAFMEGRLDDEGVSNEVFAEYRQVFSRGITPLQAKGMRDQFAVLLWAAPKQSQPNLKRICAALEIELRNAEG